MSHQIHRQTSAFIPLKKVKLFDDMFNSIHKKVGTKVKAYKLIGLSEATIKNMKNGDLTSYGARKILDAYKDLFKLK